MENKDIRWIQRFNNYCKALDQLTLFMRQDSLNEMEQQGLVKSFEYNHELAWKTMKDLLEHQGYTGILGSRDATREAFKLNLLGDDERQGKIWMDMIKSRNLTSHTYNEEVTQEIVGRITDDYYGAFIAFRERLRPLTEVEQE